MNQERTYTQNIIYRIKNNPVVASLIFLGTIVITLATFTDAAKNLLSLISKQNPEEARIELNKMSLEYTTEVFLESVKKNDIKALKLFLVAGMDPNVTESNGNTALMYAVRNRNIEIINDLIEAKADINKQNLYGYTALSTAAEIGDIDVIKYLIKKEANVQSINSAFIIAAKFGRIELLSMLTKQGAESNKVGSQALMSALTSYKFGVTEKKVNQTIKFLLKQGIDVNTNFEEGWTPLLLSAFSINSDDSILVLKTLLNRGVNVNAQCECKNTLGGGWTALMFVARSGNLDAVQALINKGAEVNLKNNNGQTALILSAKQSNIEIVQTLLNKGAEVNKKDNEGRTALMIASNYGSIECVRILLAHNALTSIEDIHGKTALDHAKEKLRLDPKVYHTIVTLLNKVE